VLKECKFATPLNKFVNWFLPWAQKLLLECDNFSVVNCDIFQGPKTLGDKKRKTSRSAFENEPLSSFASCGSTDEQDSTKRTKVCYDITSHLENGQEIIMSTDEVARIQLLDAGIQTNDSSRKDKAIQVNLNNYLPLIPNRIPEEILVRISSDDKDVQLADEELTESQASFIGESWTCLSCSENCSCSESELEMLKPDHNEPFLQKFGKTVWSMFRPQELSSSGSD
jgi:hypothetical protein